MKFGVRECADVVLRAKSAQKIGNKIFYKNEPVCYFDTLKTSTFEGAATTVYAQGGRGNARLMSWDGERTVTFTMEDALISPIGLSILTGAGLIEAKADAPITQHIAETTDNIAKKTANGEVTGTTPDDMVIFVAENPEVKQNGAKVEEPTIYVMVLDDHGEVVSEPYLFKKVDANAVNTALGLEGNAALAVDSANGGFINTPTSPYYKKYPIMLAKSTVFKYNNGSTSITYTGINETDDVANGNVVQYKFNTTLFNATKVMVDYYTQKESGAVQIDITPDKFGGTFYLEASTLWRDQGSGKDLPAEFIIPNCKVQSNFSFTLASSGDPSSFTFTMDAFPDYTRWDSSEKVLARIQVIGMNETGVDEVYREQTWSKYDADSQGLVTGKKADS